MSAVVGIDLSSRQLDLVSLHESYDAATHLRISLERTKQETAWTRTLAVRELMPPDSWWDDVLVVAIEAPYGPGMGSVAILNRIAGAIAASLPARLRELGPRGEGQPVWIVRPDEWKTALGIHGKPSAAEVERLGIRQCGTWAQDQDARDALCIAYYVRETNKRTLSAA